MQLIHISIVRPPFQDIMQEIEARQTLVSTVQHQGEALLRGVSTRESEELGKHFRQMQDAQRHLMELAEEKRHLLLKAVSDRQDLGRRLERVSKWLSDKHLADSSTKFPFSSQDTRKALETLKVGNGYGVFVFTVYFVLRYFV